MEEHSPMTIFSFDSPTLTCNNFTPVDEDTLKRCKSNSFTLRMLKDAEGELGRVEIICNACQMVTKVFE